MAEIAFPIGGKEDGTVAGQCTAESCPAGGLLSCGFSSRRHGYVNCSSYHPHIRSGYQPTYWWLNLARAEHPLQTTAPEALSPDFFSSDYADFCKAVQAKYPTLLGTTAWGCYWEWVWTNMGASRYMHNPEMWGMLQFAGTPSRELSTPLQSDPELCHPIDFPARYVAAQLYRAQLRHMLAHKNYATTVDALLDPQLCSPETSCDAGAIKMAQETPARFALHLQVEETSKRCVNYIDNGGVPPPPPPAVPAGMSTGGPCFAVTVVLNGTSAEGLSFALAATVTEDRFTTVQQLSALPEQRICL
eukprot:SAG31_NODE_1824_length_7190_cov_43.812015_3_plen_303_part_00